MCQPSKCKNKCFVGYVHNRNLWSIKCDMFKVMCDDVICGHMELIIPGYQQFNKWFFFSISANLNFF